MISLGAGRGSSPLLDSCRRPACPRRPPRRRRRQIVDSDKIDWIEPAEALRVIVRALWPARLTLADEITDLRWFHYPKTMVESGRATTEEHDVTKRALGLFHEKRTNGAVRASGVFNGVGRRELIEPSEVARGDLGIWKRELDCTIRGYPKRMYVDVLVSRRDVEAAIADSVSPAPDGGEKDATPSKRFNQTSADEFTRQFITNERNEGRRPTLGNLEAAALAAGKRGVRDLLRNAYRRLMPHQGFDTRVGRPTKAPQKPAKK
jgi:hypothetical protein